jgi:7-cyano-7-deazaguanine synthase
MSKALVVLSGGQDSTTCLFIAKHHGYELHAITFDYGQRHRIEIDAASKVAELAGVASHEIIKVPDILVSASPLTSDAPLEQYADAESMDAIIGDRVEKTFVPMRNPFFLTIAVNRAIALGCDTIVTGICQEDNANYPDCTEQFRVEFERMTRYALKRPDLTISAPLMYLSKAETVQRAHSMPDCWEALAYTHTSYDGCYPPTDMNHANVLRAAGFEKAGLPDPLVLRAVREGLMELPATSNYDEVRT